jgi:glycine/serine hydroxymethyltransferase
MQRIGALILKALEGEPDAAAESSLRSEVGALCRAFPYYTWLRPARERTPS